MRSSKSRSRSKSNRQRSIGNIINRVFESSGPEGKVRGTPQQIIDKYLGLARDAQLSNDRVAEQNFLQHAEHYTRLLHEAQREMAQRQPNGQGNGNQNGAGQGNGPSGADMDQPAQAAMSDAASSQNDGYAQASAPATPQGETGGWRKRDTARDVERVEAEDSNLVETPESRSDLRVSRESEPAPVASAEPQPERQPEPAAAPAAEEAPDAAEKPKRPRKPRAKKADTADGEKPKAPRNRRKPKAASEEGNGEAGPSEDAPKAANG
ncbi:DUF4167 domain-containing protein [Thioclava sp. GXIMD4216]|uniref:DUF4167 domain-containing protein n=1 Tax=Thioclava sp. GXIMD4216 TaxID=3131929 RepID=UPI0030D01BAF